MITIIALQCSPRFKKCLIRNLISLGSESLYSEHFGKTTVSTRARHRLLLLVTKTMKDTSGALRERSHLFPVLDQLWYKSARKMTAVTMNTSKCYTIVTNLPLFTNSCKDVVAIIIVRKLFSWPNSRTCFTMRELSEKEKEHVLIGVLKSL